jgi:cyanophycinase-like exopeptidase
MNRTGDAPRRGLPGDVYLAASSHPQTLLAMIAQAAASIPRDAGRVPRVAVSQVAARGRSAGHLAHLFERSFERVEVSAFRVAGEGDAMPAHEARAIVERADVVFFGGGDPVEGARLLAAAGADAWIREAHARGAACMGVSAGAMLLGAWWAAWPDSPPPPQDDAAPSPVTGDGGELVRCTAVLPDLVIDCHAEEDNWNELHLVRALLADHLGKSAHLPRFLGLPSGTGIVVSPGGAYRSVGGDPVAL